MDQQFSLTWNNFHGNLTKGFAGLLGNGEFVDVTIAVDGHLLQAHKVILSICSPYFKRMFQTNPCQHPIVVLRDVSHKAMKDLLQFMYHGEVSVKREDLNNFIGTAEVLQIKGLTNKQTDEENCEKDQELPINMEKQNNHIDTESIAADSLDTPPNNVDHNNEDEIVKQREFIEKLQRFSNLKRKSEELLQKNYYNDMLINEKRTKLKDKPSHNRSNNHHQHNNHFETMKKYYDDNLVDIRTSLNTHHVQKPTDMVKQKIDTQEEEHSSPVEIKTECEDDIIVTDPAVCTVEKEYDSLKDGNKDSYVPLEFQAPQDSALSLVINSSSDDQQLPVRYKYIYSRKGHKQLVHMNFVYTKHSTTHGKTSWRCVQYFSLNRCPATVETIDNMIYAVNHQHNHENCYEKLSRNSIYEMNPSPK